MISSFIYMNGYGLFVWLSFGIVFFSCMIFYLKTKKTLKKYEKEFLNELKNLSESERKKVLERSKVANQVLAANSKLN
tara:strand:+ start:2014 stop:2247 length:234 start_codon:yes stop_codon:yes gene_type:complete